MACFNCLINALNLIGGRGVLERQVLKANCPIVRPYAAEERIGRIGELGNSSRTISKGRVEHRRSRGFRRFFGHKKTKHG